MTRSYKILIYDILESIKLIEDYTSFLEKEGFLASRQVQDAVMRRIEIIGEAAKNLPKEFKIKHKDIPWKEIVAMRNILIHEYFGVDLELTWKTIQKDIPILKKKLSRLLKKVQ